MKPFWREAQTSQIQENSQTTFDSRLKITVCLGGRVLQLKADPDYLEFVFHGVVHRSYDPLSDVQLCSLSVLCWYQTAKTRDRQPERDMDSAAEKLTSSAGRVCGESRRRLCRPAGEVVLKMGMNEGKMLWHRYIWCEHRVKIHTMAGWGKDSQMSHALALVFLTTHMTAVTLRATSVVKNSLKAEYLGLPINLYGRGKTSLWNRKRTSVAFDSPQPKINEFVCISALRWSVSHFAASLTAAHNISSGIIPARLRRSVLQQVTENIGDIPLADNIKYCLSHVLPPPRALWRIAVSQGPASSYKMVFFFQGLNTLALR